tara:strand:+ start:424 stop:1074 length:651 start_codon:yes stop_codon:yes gene_type:complete
MKVEINVPNDLKEIKLHQYQRFLKYQTDNKDEKKLASKMIEIFCGLKLTDAMKMKVGDVYSITNILTEMFNQKPKLVRRFFINGIEYGFIPDLDEMSLGEYIDLDTYLGDWDNIHRAMNVLYRPVKNKYKEKYNINEYTPDNPDLLKNMPMDAVLSSILFFYRLGIDLSKAMMNYLEDKQKTNLVQYLNSEANGVGINQFTDSLKGILEDLKISLN